MQATYLNTVCSFSKKTLICKACPSTIMQWCMCSEGLHIGCGRGGGEVASWCGDTAGAGRRSGRIPPQHESETAGAPLSCRKSTITSRWRRAAAAGDAGRAKTAISTPATSSRETRRPGRRGEIANNCRRPLNDSFHLLKR